VLRRASVSVLGLMALVGVAVAEPIVIELISAEVGYDQRAGQPVVNFKMSKASGIVFAQFSQQNVGRKFELRVDGKTVSASVIREPILGGSGQISDNFTPEQANDIAARLSSRPSTIEVELAP
jgi:preprotein translocase subunit SecD